MTLERLRDLCLSFADTTEQIQWGKDLVFKVGGRMFCVANTDPAGHEIAMSFKCDPETFAELCERDGIKPAPYLARAQWVGVEQFDTLSDRELKPLLTRAHQLISAKTAKNSSTKAATAPTAKAAKAKGTKKKEKRR
jgi:predicted DNA-binding protein (MmcQ/YjbR family)